MGIGDSALGDSGAGDGQCRAEYGDVQPDGPKKVSTQSFITLMTA